MFGTEKDFKEFTSELKSRGMHLIVDGVFNHVGDDSIYFDRYGKYNTVGAYEYWSYVYDLMNNEGIDQEVAMTKAEEYFVESGQTFSEEKWHLWFNIKNSKVDVGTTNERYDYQGWWGYDSLPEFKSLTKDEAIELGLAKEDDEFVNYCNEKDQSLSNLQYAEAISTNAGNVNAYQLIKGVICNSSRNDYKKYASYPESPEFYAAIDESFISDDDLADNIYSYYRNLTQKKRVQKL